MHAEVGKEQGKMTYHYSLNGYFKYENSCWCN